MLIVSIYTFKTLVKYRGKHKCVYVFVYRMEHVPDIISWNKLKHQEPYMIYYIMIQQSIMYRNWNSVWCLVNSGHRNLKIYQIINIINLLFDRISSSCGSGFQNFKCRPLIFCCFLCCSFITVCKPGTLKTLS